MNPLHLFGVQRYIILRKKQIHIAQISVHLLKLFLFGFPDLFDCMFSVFGKAQVILSDILTIHIGVVIMESEADIVNVASQIPVGFIQKIKVLWKSYLLRYACRIQNQCAFVFSGCIITSSITAVVSRRRIIIRGVVRYHRKRDESKGSLS